MTLPNRNRLRPNGNGQSVHNADNPPPVHNGQQQLDNPPEINPVKTTITPWEAKALKEKAKAQDPDNGPGR